MKINRLEFENFRNFKDHGEIKFSTDGKATIIYGENGDGKTTLHQLFQWVFYGKINFNNTTTDKLYNLKFESERPYGEVFNVMGRIDFEHDSSSYSLTRTQTYKKNLNDSEKVKEEVQLNKLDGDYNWRRVDNPVEVIDKMLPSGLSDYFFFDGESMIADLRTKSVDSASKLKKALYSMFDLDVLDSAAKHIGNTDLKTTVLGKLYLSKGTLTSDEFIKTKKAQIEGLQNKLDDLKTLNAEKEAEKNKQNETIKAISQEIGGTPSKAEYERKRADLKRQRDVFIKNAGNLTSEFGNTVSDMFPRLLISKTIKDATKRIKLKISENKLPEGINVVLIDHLLNKGKCICDRELGEDEIKLLKSYKDMLPPKSFTALYNQFTNTAKLWGTGYDKDKLEKYIQDVLSNEKEASKCDQDIDILDKEKEHAKDVENLIIDRKKAEARVKELDDDLKKLSNEIYKYEVGLKKMMKEYDELTDKTNNGKIAQRKIDIMQAVHDYFQEKIDKESERYSKKLQVQIQQLIDTMATTKRKVSVSPNFSVSVYDSYNDESKSEGQFAVVSFAYIGGILQMLKNEPQLANKEYPLVLDGPFSKLDNTQKQNVIDNISSFANQVILFSKDNLQDYFDKDMIGRVWTLQSNDEKNVATVSEGFLWK